MFIMSPVLTAIGAVMLVIGKGALFVAAIFSSTAAIIVGSIVGIVAVTVAIVKNSVITEPVAKPFVHNLFCQVEAFAF